MRYILLILTGHDTVTANEMLLHPSDARCYKVAASILYDLSIRSIKLLTNNPDKIDQLRNCNIVISERLPILPDHWWKTSSLKDESGIGEIIQSSRTSFEEVTLVNEITPLNRENDKAEQKKERLSLNMLPESFANASSESFLKSDSVVNGYSEMDRYMLTKINRMKHMMDIPDYLMEDKENMK